MPVSLDLNARVREDERMDDPALDRRSHLAALRGLSRINWISRSASALWPHIRSLASRLNRPVRVLDVATGGGDIPLGLGALARREDRPLDIAACDISRRAIAVTRARMIRAGLAGHFFIADAVNGDIPAEYDVLTSTLFLHHLEREQAITFLSRMQQAAKHMVLVDDLRRCVMGACVTYLGTRVLSRSPVVHTDGMRSVRAAFTPDEICELARAAGMENATVTPHWPWRHLLRWQRGETP